MVSGKRVTDLVGFLSVVWPRITPGGKVSEPPIVALTGITALDDLSEWRVETNTG